MALAWTSPDPTQTVVIERMRQQVQRWQRIARTTGETYEDHGARGGQTWCYRVKAQGDDNWSPGACGQAPRR